LQLSLCTEPRRVHDRLAYGLNRRSGPGALNVAVSRPVTTPAIDPLRNGGAQEQFSPAVIPGGSDFRIGVVAKEAFPIYFATKVHVVRTVVTRIHGPKSALFRIPADGQLDKL